MQPRLAWNSQFSCLILLSPENTSVYHHAWPLLQILPQLIFNYFCHVLVGMEFELTASHLLPRRSTLSHASSPASELSSSIPFYLLPSPTATLTMNCMRFCLIHVHTWMCLYGSINFYVILVDLAPNLHKLYLNRHPVPELVFFFVHSSLTDTEFRYSFFLSEQHWNPCSCF
jgi:hypothetical protein